MRRTDLLAHPAQAKLETFPHPRLKMPQMLTWFGHHTFSVLALPDDNARDVEVRPYVSPTVH